MTGISFAEYIRNRKLTLAGYDLKSTHMKVVEVSYKYGYDSPTSFTRAFQLFHGITPKAARDEAAQLRVYPKMQLYSSTSYTWRVEKKGAFRLIGKSIQIMRGDQPNKIPEFWSNCHRDGTFHQMLSMNEAATKGIFGLYICDDLQEQKMKYSIMVTTSQEAEKDFQEIHIPAATWAIFDCYGAVPKAIQNGWKYLREEWLVRYPFHHAAAPELEWYSDGNVYDETYSSQIWIPIMEE